MSRIQGFFFPDAFKRHQEKVSPLLHCRHFLYHREDKSIGKKYLHSYIADTFYSIAKASEKVFFNVGKTCFSCMIAPGPIKSISKSDLGCNSTNPKNIFLPRKKHSKVLLIPLLSHTKHPQPLLIQPTVKREAPVSSLRKLKSLASTLPNSQTRTSCLLIL